MQDLHKSRVMREIFSDAIGNLANIGPANISNTRIASGEKPPELRAKPVVFLLRAVAVIGPDFVPDQRLAVGVTIGIGQGFVVRIFPLVGGGFVTAMRKGKITGIRSGVHFRSTNQQIIGDRISRIQGR